MIGFHAVRAAQQLYLILKKYNCVKYKNSPYHKGALLWDNLPIVVRNSTSLLEFNRQLEVV